MTRDSHPIVTPQFVFGLLLTAAGTLFLLDNLGIADAHRYVQYWPAALVLIGVAKLVRARSLPAIVAAFGWTLAGVWLLGWNVGWVRTSFWGVLRTYWPAILVFIGLSVVFRTLRRERAPAGDPRNMLSVVAVLGGNKRTSSAPAFRGGEFTALLGGTDVDLRGATMEGRQAVVDVFAMWGGVSLQVPEGWAVESQVSAFLGGIDDKTRPVAGHDHPTLIIRGIVLMGGLEIKN